MTNEPQTIPDKITCSKCGKGRCAYSFKGGPRKVNRRTCLVPKTEG